MDDRISRTVQRTPSSTIRELLALTAQPDVLSLAGGLPARELLPIERVAAAAAAVFGRRGPDVLQYGPTDGVPELREFVASRHTCATADVLITSGSQQGLDLVARALLDPNDGVVVAAPAYMGAVQAFAAAGATVFAVASTPEGMDLARVAQLCQRNQIKALYVVPNFHNPTGASMSLDQRISLGNLCESHGVVVIEDDPYGEIRFTGDRHPSIAELSNASVVQLRTTSKTLAPGLRVAWIVAPPWLRDACSRLKQGTDLHSPTLNQMIVHTLLQDGAWYTDHLARVCAAYGARAEALCRAAGTAFGDRVVVDQAQGGLFTWIEFVDGTDTEVELQRAMANGVAFVPGSAFSVAGVSARHAARLCHASLPPTALCTALHRWATGTTDSYV